MIVALISDDQRLYELCKAILAELSPELSTNSSYPRLAYLFQTQTSTFGIAYRNWMSPSISRRRVASSYLLIDRSDLQGAGAPLRGAMLVLRPVTKAALAAGLSRRKPFAPSLFHSRLMERAIHWRCWQTPTSGCRSVIRTEPASWLA